MVDKLDESKKAVDDVYKLLSNSVKEIIAPYTKELENIIKELSKGINLFSNQDLWDFQVRISLEAYKLGNVKDLSTLKDSCAEALYKESLAKEFIITSGTQEVKKQQSILNSVEKQAVAMLHKAVSDTLKTKCDEAHRLVNVLQSIQISRASEAKLSSSPRSEIDDISVND